MWLKQQPRDGDKQQTIYYAQQISETAVPAQFPHNGWNSDSTAED